MIPYFQITSVPVGPLQIQVWGFFVAIGMLLAVLVGRRAAKRHGLDPEAFTDLASTVIIGGLVGARLFHAFAYEPSAFVSDPLALLRVWEGGMSMFGGLLGGALGAYAYARTHREGVMALVGVAAYVLPLGYGISRIGCFLIHDHPGTLSSAFFAVQYPDGARLDHGFLLMFAGFAMFALFVFLERRARAMADFTALFMVCYGTVRLILDFWRASDIVGADVRYVGLTPAQYVSFLLIIFGAAALLRSRPRVHALLP